MSAKTIDDGGPVHSLSVHPAHGYGASASVEQGESRRQALARCAMQGLMTNPILERDYEKVKKMVAICAYSIADEMIAFEVRERAEMEQKK